jgi:hypothetical protein
MPRKACIVASVVFACSAPDPDVPSALLTNARLICTHASRSCFGETHTAFFATSDSRDHVVAMITAAFPSAAVDATIEDGHATLIQTGPTDSFLVYGPEETSVWLKENCPLSNAEPTIVQTDRTTSIGSTHRK